MIDESRAERACTDVLAVEETAPGLVEVVTLGGSYAVDARGEGCHCPDKEFNGVPRCKHEHAAVLATSDELPAAFIVEENLHDRHPGFKRHEPADFGAGESTGVELL